MLRELKIKDFAIIDTLAIEFTGGMNIFTGETGAGKSIIIDAVNLILGARGSTDFIRSGCEEAKVEALFDISGDSALKKTLRDTGYEAEDELVIKRVLSASGKNKVIINDSMSTLSALSALLPSLINIYGQHEHQELLIKEKHLELLDSFGSHASQIMEYSNSYFALKEVEAKLASIKKSADNREKEIDFITFQLSEIDSANLKQGEEEALKSQKALLTNAERILDTCNYAFDELYDKSGSVSSVLGEIIEKLDKVKSLDKAFESQQTEIKNALFTLDDAATFFRDYQKKIDLGDVTLDDLETRLDVISKLKKKYGGSIDAVFATKATLEDRLDELTNLTENSAKLEIKRGELFSETTALAEKLSKKRRDSAEKLTKNIAGELKSLGLENAAFIVKFYNDPKALNLSETGADEVEFYFSANPGEEHKPLRKVASGGELSRIMLALKNAARSDDAVASTLIFDEVDAGIGGKTAHIVGAKLKNLADTFQVICVTHLSQIASYADSHYHVTKEQSGGRTTTKVRALSHNERVNEVARLFSGETITQHSLKHASDMILKNSKGVSP